VGMLAVWSGEEHDSAEGFLKEGLVLNREVGNWSYGAYCLEGFAGLAGARGQGARAARLWGAAEALRTNIGAPLPPEPRPYYERSMAAARARLGEEAWEAGFAEGKAMGLEEAVEYALSEAERTTTSPDASFAAEQEASAGRRQPPNLTRREKEIAALVARGLTSRQIASKLVLSAHTVDKHVANILKKLEVSSREQVAARMNERPAHRRVSP
jgi:DNA-binding CsgD family transcriptional regulator